MTIVWCSHITGNLFIVWTCVFSMELNYLSVVKLYDWENKIFKIYSILFVKHIRYYQFEDKWSHKKLPFAHTHVLYSDTCVSFVKCTTVHIC